MLTMLESLNYSFRNPKNIIWVMYRIKQSRNYKKNHGVLRGPQLDKQRWRARLGILRVNKSLQMSVFNNTGQFAVCISWSTHNIFIQRVPQFATRMSSNKEDFPPSLTDQMYFVNIVNQLISFLLFFITFSCCFVYWILFC